MAKLTTRFIEALKGEPSRRVEVQDDDTPGLYIRVSAKGAKSWMLRCTAKEGRRIKAGLGKFPGIGLSQARERARKEMVAVQDGHDPAAEKRKAKREARQNRITKPQTLGALWRPYCDAKAKRKALSTRDYQEWLWAKHIAPLLGACSLKDLDRPIIKLALREIAKSGDTNANNAQTLLTGIINWAVGEAFMQGNPIARLDREYKKASRERELTDDELRTLCDALSKPFKHEGKYVSARMQAALKLALVTAARGGEVMGLHAREVDPVARSWTIPSTRSKTRRQQVIPLSPAAVAVLSEAFRGDGETEPKPITAWEGFAFPKPRDASKSMRRGSFTQAMKWIVQARKIDRATPHDLRRTVATRIASERIGCAPHIVSAVLGHQQEGPAVTQTYNRYRYDKEKRHALEAWAALLDEIVNNKPRATNVTPLRGGA